MNTSRGISLGLAAIVTGLLAVPVSVGQTPYKIAVVPWVGWSPVYVAEAEGFWQDLGVDVEVVSLESNIRMNQALMEGDVAIQFDMLGSAVGRFEEGHPVVIIAETDWSDGGDKIIIKKGRDVSELKNGTVGVYLDEPSLTYFLNCYLSKHQLQVADFTLQQESPDDGLSKFVNGEFPILVTYDPYATTAVDRGGGVVVATSADYPGSIPEGMLMLKSTFEQTPKADLEKIIQGWAKAAAWSDDPDNWEQYQQILNDRVFAGVSPRSEADLKALFNEVKIHSPLQMLERNEKGGATEAFLEEMRSFLAANHALKRDFLPEKIFFGEVVHDALSGRKLEK